MHMPYYIFKKLFACIFVLTTTTTTAAAAATTTTTTATTIITTTTTTITDAAYVTAYASVIVAGVKCYY